MIELQTCQQVAADIGLSPRTLEKLRTTGGGPRYVKLGKRVLYDPADIAAWVEKCKVSNTSEWTFKKRT